MLHRARPVVRAAHVSVLAAVPMVGACSLQDAANEESLPPIVDLSASASSLLTDVWDVERVVELTNGTLAFVEGFRSTVVFHAPTAGTTRRIGRKGQGPGEFRTRPMPILRLGGDTVAVPTGMGRYLHLFTEDDGFLRRQATPIGERFNSVTLASDGEFVYCMTEGAIDGWDVGGEPADSSVIYRFRPGDTSLHPVWHTGSAGFKRFAGPGKSYLVMREPFAPSNFFGVSQGGTIWRILDRERRVDSHRRDGGTTYGPVWRVDHVAVTAEARDSVRAHFQDGPFAQFQLTYQHLHPLVVDAAGGPLGTIWVGMKPQGERDPVYFRFDSAGRITGRYRLGPNTRITGVGTDAIYAVRTDADGLATLVRFTRPRL